MAREWCFIVVIPFLGELLMGGEPRLRDGGGDP